MASAGKKRASKLPQKGGSAKKSAPVQIQSTEILLSISQAAAEFGHDRATITKRVSELQLQPAEKRRGYAVYRLRDLLEMERRTPDGEVDPDKLNPFERGAFYKAELDRLKLDESRGVLMRRELVEVEWARVLKGIAQELDTIVDEVERDVGAPPLVLEKLEAKIDEMRERMFSGVISVGEISGQEKGEDAASAVR